MSLTTPCLVSPWGKTQDGYAQYKVKGVAFLGHRLAAELAFGQIPLGQVVRHKCDNPGCVNPFHLELGTHQDNMDDRNKRGRQASGQRHANAKLTDEMVASIRQRLANGEKGRHIAKDYGVTESTVSTIKTGKHWVGAGHT